jgi:flagellar protein FliO/FliZ
MRQCCGVVILVLLAASVALAESSTQPITDGQIIRRSAPAPAANAAATSNQASSPPGIAQVALSLTAVLGLIVLLYWASRRFLPRSALGQPTRAIQVLARTAISPKQRILLLQIGRRMLVVGDSGQSLSTLCEITDPDEAAALLGQVQGEKPRTTGKSFQAALDDAAQQFQPSPPKDRPAELDAMHAELDALVQRVRGMARQIEQQQQA